VLLPESFKIIDLFFFVTQALNASFIFSQSLDLNCFPAEGDKNSSQSSNICMLHFPVGFVRTLGGTCSV